MRNRHFAVALGAGFAGLSQATLAASQEESLANVTMLILYGSIAFAAVVIASIYFLKSQDRRLAPLSRVFVRGEAIYSVAADATVADCVGKMTTRKIGALVVLEGESLMGIFTERDALNRVLAAGLDPARVKVADVMTREPVVVTVDTTVGDAMALVTKRRFRHLPVVENGKLLAVVSSGDLTRWLVQEKGGEVQELVGLAASG